MILNGFGNLPDLYRDSNKPILQVLVSPVFDPSRYGTPTSYTPRPPLRGVQLHLLVLHYHELDVVG